MQAEVRKKHIVDMTKASRIIMLVLCDVFLINLASFLALWIRFEFSLELMRQSGFLESIYRNAVPYTVMTLGVFELFRLYTSLWEFAGLDELIRIAAACVCASLLGYVTMKVFGMSVPRSYPVLNCLFLVLLVVALRFSYRVLRKRKRREGAARRTMLIGAGGAASIALRDFSGSSNSSNKVVCLIDDDVSKHGRYLRGIRIAGGRQSIPEAVKKYRVEEIIFAIPSASNRQRKEILEICQHTGCKLKTLPGLLQIVNGEVSVSNIRDVEIEDLLGREAVLVDLEEISEYTQGRVILVTGGGGSIGSELCRQLAARKPKMLIIFDIYENSAYEIQQEILREHPDVDLKVFIGSVRDEKRVNELFAKYRPQLVFHAAAHKHVPLMEQSPNEAVKNNVFGTLNVARAASRFGAKRMLLISTDKAVRPTNVMGASKRVCEMIVQMMDKHSATEYVAVRFGNVLGSNGSVIPLFRKQIEQGGPVTVTHKDIIRYFMTIPEAVALVLQAGVYARGGEIFVLDMGEPVHIDELARKMIRLSGFEPDVDIPIVYTGLRPGEKLYEELLLEGEGILKTDNDLIYIGHPLIFDDDELMSHLERLKKLSGQNSAIIRDELMAAVPGYRITE